MQPTWNPSRFAANRARLLGALGPGEAALLFGGDEVHRNSDSTHRFRVHSDVHYLSGWEDPEVAVLLRAGADKPFILFVQPRDQEKEIWDGVRPGPEGAKTVFGADEAWSYEELSKQLPDLLMGYRVLHYRFAEDAARDRLVRGAIHTAARKARRETWQDVPDTLVDPERLLHELRLSKTPDELALLRRAAAITAEAHLSAMAMTRPGVFEYQLEAAIDHTFRARGGVGPGYETIVGGGANATILHYRSNNQVLQDGDLVCVDAGCEYGLYTADVTRTWPVNGRFSPAQRELYELVLDCQKACVAACRAGTSWKTLNDLCNRMLTEGMVRLGILNGEPEKLIEEKKHKKYYPHGLGHWLGMDVHDVGAYTRADQSRPLSAGNVLTIEPGLYIRPDDLEAPERFRGLGVRIEDDVLVTEGDPDVLTASIPKEIADVEAAVGGSAAS